MAACTETDVASLLNRFKREIATAMALMGVNTIGEIIREPIEEA